MARLLPRTFYARPTLVVARELIGKVLVHDTQAGVASGVIVEVEAYIGESDPACHAAPGPTVRNAPLYGPPGFAYVYINYGIHYLVLPLMRRRRARSGTRGAAAFSDVELCRGPGNLSRALGITLRQNRLDLTSSRLRIEDQGLDARPIRWSRRIGINVGVEDEWRVYALDSAAVSGTTKAAF
ncbi:MAG: 3-methyladenine DNA glycosylase [Acidobacteria bacterium]|nr:MAG: 3-methyladenine DNA glycosylase [Acidobacteriota bacterium]